jgi:hypothetical protein
MIMAASYCAAMPCLEDGSGREEEEEEKEREKQYMSCGCANG